MLFTNDQEKYQCILHQCKVIHYVLQWVGQDTLLDVILDLTMSSMYGLNQIVGGTPFENGNRFVNKIYNKYLVSINSFCAAIYYHK